MFKYIIFFINSQPVGNSGLRTAWGGQIGGLESCFSDMSTKINRYQLNKCHKF